MAGFQDVLDAVARVVGGTQPGPNQNPRFFSGALTGDGTGVAGLLGCWSAPPEQINDFPTGLVLMGQFELGSPGDINLETQGQELQIDNLKLLILQRRVSPTDTIGTDAGALTQYRDSIPSAFAAHMGLFGTTGVIDAVPHRGGFGLINYGGIEHLGIDFTIRVRRILSRTYTA